MLKIHEMLQNPIGVSKYLLSYTVLFGVENRRDPKEMWQYSFMEIVAAEWLQ